jgi:processive 1,2-diacylglycerol beta-glucosyltransferase
MIHLQDKDTGAAIGTISEEQLQYLVDQLEEESRDDQDYYINAATLDLFEERGADKMLVTLLRTALGGRTEMEIRWSRR